MVVTKLYLETTVWNFLLTDDSPEKRRYTEILFKEIESGKYDIFISDFVYDEIRRAQEDKIRELEKLIRNFNPPVLKPDAKFHALARNYSQAAFIPERFVEDIYHVAIASVNEMDIIVSWNLKHIVKLKTKKCANTINKAEGYKTIDILTPEEVIDYD